VTRAACILALGAALASACSPPAPAREPGAASPKIARAFSEAFEAEALDPNAGAKYLDAIDLAVGDPEAAGALALTVASIDALVLQTPPGFDIVGPTAIAHRSRAMMRSVVGRLEQAYGRADPDAHPGTPLPIMRASIAQALHELAMYSGDLQAAEVWGERRGCVNAAAVIGPLDWTPLRALDKPSPIPAIGPLAGSYRGVAPFAAQVVPVTVRADQCQLDVSVTSYVQGLRAVVVDFDNPKQQRAFFSLTSTSAAVLDVGGVTVARRGFEVGGYPVTKHASIELGQGRVRAVVRVAQKGDGNTLELTAHGEDGAPLVAHAPRRGDVARVRGGRAAAIEVAPRGGGTDDTVLAAAALLALGEARPAEHLLEARRSARGPARETPGLELLYARAIELAEDIPETKAVERLRSSVARVLEVWPASWEARVHQARAVERRKAAGEGTVEALRGLLDQREKASPRDVMVLAYAAALAKKLRFPDVSEQLYTEVARLAPDSALLANLDLRLHSRVGGDLLKATCEGGISRSDTDCLEARRQRGDYRAALAELERLRRIRGAPDALRPVELAILIAKGDVKGALAVHDQIHPTERRIFDGLGFAAGRGYGDAVKRRLARDEANARDAPYALGAVNRALGLDRDPSPELEAEGRKLVLADQKSAFLPGAATAVLRHIERYTLEANGLVRYVEYDLRRVSGTSDVAAGASAPGPLVDGRSAPRLQRRRIHKRDGRILEPDAAQNSQQQSDLSQLEAGDYIEQILMGWALPGDSGQITIDTPDLMPERTSIREGVIEVKRAPTIPLSIWAHALLGKPTERREGAYTTTTWRIKDAAPRSFEDGVPRNERSVAVSMGTQTWANIANAMEENVRSLHDADPFVRRFALEAAGPDRTISRALVERVVHATGKAVKVASAADLTDAAAVLAFGSQRNTARTVLELGQGSRSWVIYRVLRELGVSVDLAVAEKEPYGSAPGYPPHTGRFRHPLVVARLGSAGGDVWIDADVQGPPLPPGRTSPELRGRLAMFPNGQTMVVGGAADEIGDEIDIRLVVDERGDARGSFTSQLYGRAAQGLAEAFQTVAGSDRRELLRSVVLGWVPWADVEDVSFSATPGAWGITVRASIAIHGYGRLEGKDGKVWSLAGLEPVHLVYPNRHVGTLAASYASRGSRQNALSIDVALQYHVRRRIELPKGATVTRAPPSIDVKEPRFSAARKVTIQGSVIEEDFRLNLPTGTVAAEQYDAFVKKVHAVDDGFMTGARVRVKP
jgi:hypothetical protein